MAFPRGPDAPLSMPAGQLVALRAAAREDLQALFRAREACGPVEWVRGLRDVSARLAELTA